MKHFNVFGFLLSAALLLASWNVSAVGTVKSGTPTTAYGLLLFDNNEQLNDVVSFPFPEADTFHVIHSFGYYQWVCAAAWHEDKYYVTTEDLTSGGAGDIFIIDLETGERTDLASLAEAGLPNKIADMTYDYSTNTMYAVSGQMGGSGAPGTSSLYTMNLESGAMQKVADLPNFFFSLACSYDGQLYGVAKYGDFYKIDKTTGGVTRVGATGINPTGIASMEFDHTNKALYWAVNDLQPTSEASYLCMINVETGVATVIGEPGSNRESPDAQLAGLYIPFSASADGTPQAVADLSIVPDATGACKAVLSWTNPTKLFGTEAEITAAIQVKIYRNDELVATVENANPGQQSTYTDEIEGQTGLLVTYKVVPVNQTGDGVATKQTLFVGTDVPAAPQQLTVVKNAPASATISWQAPAKGANGGWIDVAGLTYDVVRQPGDVVLTTGLKALTYTDESVTVSDSYTYEVTAKTAAGSGEPAVSEPVVLGPVNELPYFCGFENEDEASTWKIVNGNDDKSTWTFARGSMYYNGGIPYFPYGPADDWLISSEFSLEAGKKYRLSYSQKALGTHKLRVYIGQGNTPDDMTVQLHDDDAIVQSNDYSTVDCLFTVQEDGYYNIAFYCYSGEGTSYFYLTNVTLEETADNNLRMVSMTGPQTVVAGNTYHYTAVVENKGVNAAAGYKVELFNTADDAVLATAQATEELATGALDTMSVAWSPAAEGSMEIKARVVYAADEIASDNESGALALTVRPVGSNDLMEIGEVKDDQFKPKYLFNVSKYNTAALNIYSPQDLGFEEGLVEQFAFTVNNGATSAVEKIPVKVYMANTDVLKASTWIPEADMTLVYSDSISFPQGRTQQMLPLQSKFQTVKGKNLAVLTTYKTTDKKYYSNVSYPYFKTTDGSATYYYESDYTEFDFTNYGNAAWQEKASVTLDVRTSGTTISGVVKDEDGNVLADVSMTIDEDDRSLSTAADGSYAFKFLKDGMYTVRAAKSGYVTAEAKVTVTDGQPQTQDLVLDVRPAFEVKGRVLTADGQPIADAAVQLEGYRNFETATGSDGVFVFDAVYESDSAYTMSVSKIWFDDHAASVTVTDQNVDLGDVKMDYLKYRPVNVAVNTPEGENAAVIAWKNAVDTIELRTDNGRQENAIGINNATANTLIGTIYREPLALTEINWYQAFVTSYFSVDVYVLALDESGNATNKVLYKATERIYDGRWIKHVLPEPVYAPNGCVIALGYAGYLGLGTDSGKDLAYPFKEKTHVFAANYTNGEFDYIETQDFTRNLMMRAKGKLLADNGGDSTLIAEGMEYPETYTYNIWRMKRGELETPEQWVPVNAQPVQGDTYTDSFADLDAGIYAYAVRTVLPDGSMSEATYSPFFEHDMRTRVAVKVNSNSENGSAQGAVVTLNGLNYGSNGTATVAANGEALIDNLIKDRYVITVSMGGYETVKDTADFDVEDTYTTDVYTLREIIVEPFNLAVEDYNGTSALFTWNTSGVIADDFEDYDDFSINNPGEIGWSYVDGDGLPTYGFDNVEFPGMEAPMAFIVFNPDVLEIPSGSIELLKAHSGSKYLASFAASSIDNEGQNDDWLISPELSYAHDFCFSFFVSSYAAFGGYPDYFSVGYAETENPEKSDFKWLAENVSPTSDWTEYSYTVPQTAKHVAIRTVSTEEGFILMIDDVYIGSLPKAKSAQAKVGEARKPAVRYEVYLDGEKVAETETISHRFEQLESGRTYTAGVKAVYHSGESTLQTIEFGGSSGMDSMTGDAVRIYPNPTSDYLYVTGSYSRAELTTTGGSVVKRMDGQQGRLDVSDLPAGIYLLTLVDEAGNGRTVEKVTIVR